MSRAFGPLQQVVYTTLANDAELSTLTTAVVDQAQEDTQYPLVVLAPMRSTNLAGRSIGLDREQIFVDIEAWSEQQSWDECNAIIKRVCELLIGPSFDVVGPPDYHFLVYYDGAVQIRNPGGETRHITLTIRVQAYDP